MTESNPCELIERIVDQLKEGLYTSKVLVAVSGGVDSATTAKLIMKAGIPTQCIIIDTGFMRRNEVDDVIKVLKQNNISTELVSAEEKFFSEMDGIANPREKRLTFKKTYFEVIEKYLRDNNITILAQGSQSKEDKLKRGYHNVCDNEYINKNIKKIEPLVGLSKTKIREMAKELNLTKDLVERTPFPGPGLLIRFGGEFTQQKLEIVRIATEIIDNFKKNHENEFKDCFQIFPYLSNGGPVTFINKDNKTDFGMIMIIRAVSLKDGIYEPFIIKASLFQKLINSLMGIDGIARVCLDMTPKNGTIDKAILGATIEYE